MLFRHSVAKKSHLKSWNWYDDGIAYSSDHDMVCSLSNNLWKIFSMITFTVVSTWLASAIRWNKKKVCKVPFEEINREREVTKFFFFYFCSARNAEPINGEKTKYVRVRKLIRELHVCSSLDLMTVIILVKEHKRAHILPSFNSIYVL